MAGTSPAIKRKHGGANLSLLHFRAPRQTRGRVRLGPFKAYCSSKACCTAAAPSAGDIWPAATATEMSLTTRPTDGPRS
jgi:hypothetical protein